MVGLGMGAHTSYPDDTRKDGLRPLSLPAPVATTTLRKRLKPACYPQLLLLTHGDHSEGSTVLFPRCLLRYRTSDSPLSFHPSAG